MSLAKFSISLCRKEYHGLVGFLEIKFKNARTNVNLCNECSEHGH